MNSERSAWQITCDVGPAGDFLAQEGLFTTGSGYLHLRGSLEEPLGDDPQNTTYLRMPANVTAEAFPVSRQKWGTYVPGVWGQHPLLNRQMVNLPFFAGIGLEADGERLDTTTAAVSAHSRTLDMRRALLRRGLEWRTSSGALLRVEFERFVSGVRTQLCVQRVSVTADRPARLVVTSGIDSDVRTGGFDHLVSADFSSDTCGGISCRSKIDSGLLVQTECWHRGWGSGGSVSRENRAIYGRHTETLSPGRAFVFEKLSAVSTSGDLPGKLPASGVLENLPGYEVLLAEHRTEWEARWDRCDVEIGGSPSDQLAIRLSLYHLLRCLVPGDDRVAIEPKGFAGDAYFGRFFWDTEMYLLPFFLYTDPARAKALLDFRKRTLGGARENARRSGYPGARFAWESDDAGRENCAAWQYADHEVHVTADVVYAMAHYDRACPDSGYLKECAEVVVETARYWMARVDVRPGDAHPSLLGVMGPDEYAPISHNNAYTNFLVAFVLRLAAGEVGCSGGALEEERGQFAAVAESLPILRSAFHSDLVLQCEGFDRLARPKFEEFWTDRDSPYAAQVSQERLYRSQNLKQADVLMLMMLFPGAFSQAELRAAWDYYVPVTTHDSSLSAGVHAIQACRLGLREPAWEFWQKSSRMDIDGGAAQGIHIAGCGVNWQIAVFGFAGLGTAMEPGPLRLRPQLPAGWSRLAFPLVWKGNPLQVTIATRQTTVKNKGQKPVRVQWRNEERCVAPSETACFREPVRAVIFDLDGVIVSTDECHFRAWSRLASEEGIPFSAAQGERCRGVSRMESLNVVLENSSRVYGEEEKLALARRKNGYYLESIRSLGPGDLLPGAADFLSALRAMEIRTAVGSSSRNAPAILERIGLAGAFDAVADGNAIRESKPSPEVFLCAAARLELPAEECVVVEDAAAGVEAAVRAGMRVLAVGAAAGDPRADWSAPGLRDIAPETLLS